MTLGTLPTITHSKIEHHEAQEAKREAAADQPPPIPEQGAGE